MRIKKGFLKLITVNLPIGVLKEISKLIEEEELFPNKADFIRQACILLLLKLKSQNSIESEQILNEILKVRESLEASN